ncbi:MAG: hypothetical protein ACTSWC_05165 [Promethearchaeota archaeon]
MPSVVVYTKSNCQRCHHLTQWLQLHAISFSEKSLDDPITFSQISKDPNYTNEHCKKTPCKIYPPVIYFPETQKYIQNKLFNINGLRTDYLSRLLQVQHISTHSPPETRNPLSFTPKLCANELVQKLLQKYILAIGISRIGGDMLYYIQIDKSLNLDLISQFICALSMFGEENLGKIDRILIQGLKIEMSMVTRYELIFFVLFRAHMVQDHLDEESTKCLKKFYSQFRHDIEAKHTNRVLYESFDKEMCLSIQNYLVRIGVLECVDCSLEIPILRERK